MAVAVAAGTAVAAAGLAAAPRGATRTGGAEEEGREGGEGLAPAQQRAEARGGRAHSAQWLHRVASRSARQPAVLPEGWPARALLGCLGAPLGPLASLGLPLC